MTEEHIDESLYSIMYKLEPGEKLIIPLFKWKDARSYANHFKEKCGQLYSVNRMGTRKTKSDLVLVIRTK